MIDDYGDSLLVDRFAAIERAKSDGAKVVGYLPGPYVPEELIYASGALPVCLAYGGDARIANHALSLLPPVICPFARAQMGEMLLKTNPIYKAVDMLVVPSTCQHLRKIGDMWEYFEPIEVFKLGVPYDPDEGPAPAYYRGRLIDLKQRLELLTGKMITESSMADAIAVYDRLRRALRAVSVMRRSMRPPVGGLEFMKLNHASLYGDPAGTADMLEAFHRERSMAAPAVRGDAPRLMLIGPNVAIGDYGIVEMTESAGASIVIEDVFEGVRDYWCTVGSGGDPLDALVRAHLLDRTPEAFMRSSTEPRLESISRLMRDFRVAGVIWYELQCCEFYDQDAFFFETRLRESGIPMLVIESSYDDMRSGSIQTRLEAFLEVVQGGPADA